MNSGGDVGYYNLNVTSSYGRSSPRPYNYNDETSAYFVDASGGLDAEYLNIASSYGNLSPDRRDSLNGYFTNQFGYIAYDDYGVQYSYG